MHEEIILNAKKDLNSMSKHCQGNKFLIFSY